MFFISTLRSHNNENVIASLSEEYILKRRRRLTIGIQITIISWLLELLSGIIMFTRHSNGTFLFVLSDRFDSEDSTINSQIHESFTAYFGAVANFILVPGSYLLNNEVVKLEILSRGWRRFIGSKVAQFLQRNNSPNEIHPIL